LEKVDEHLLIVPRSLKILSVIHKPYHDVWRIDMITVLEYQDDKIDRNTKNISDRENCANYYHGDLSLLRQETSWKGRCHHDQRHEYHPHEPNGGGKDRLVVVVVAVAVAVAVAAVVVVVDQSCQESQAEHHDHHERDGCGPLPATLSDVEDCGGEISWVIVTGECYVEGDWVHLVLCPLFISIVGLGDSNVVVNGTSSGVVLINKPSEGGGIDDVRCLGAEKVVGRQDTNATAPLFIEISPLITTDMFTTCAQCWTTIESIITGCLRCWARPWSISTLERIQRSNLCGDIWASGLTIRIITVGARGGGLVCLCDCFWGEDTGGLDVSASDYYFRDIQATKQSESDYEEKTMKGIHRNHICRSMDED
jgi:hypothetical protein